MLKNWLGKNVATEQLLDVAIDSNNALHPLDFLTIVSYFIYCWSKKYTTVQYCHDELEMNHTTCVD